MKSEERPKNKNFIQNEIKTIKRKRIKKTRKETKIEKILMK